MSAGKSGQSAGGIGCGLFVIALVIGAVVAAGISVAALIDPFNWMPTVGRIWADCEGDCELAHRFPGFWWHAIANLVYAAIALLVLIAFAGNVGEVREKRPLRYDSVEAAVAFKQAQNELAGSAAMVAALAALPMIVAIA